MFQKYFIALCLLVPCTNTFAETVTKSVTSTSANSLKNQLPMAEWGAINELTITGPMGAADISFLSNVAKATNNLKVLNMSGVTDLLEIEKGAFSGIKSLESVSLPASLNTISEKAFMDCTSLTTITFAEGLTTINDRAFCNDSLLTSITFPSTLGDLNVSALDGCDNLQEIKVTPGNQVYSSISGVLYTMDNPTIIKYPVARVDEEFTIPDGTTNIGDNAFANCKLLKSVEMPESVKSIGKNAFLNCKGFTNVLVGDGVTTIADFAFLGCENMVAVALPRSLKTIGDGIFSRCCNITSIRCEADVPPTYSPLINNPFVTEDATICSINLATCVLSIPAKAQAKYEEAKGWGTFANIEGFQVGK